MGKYIVKVLRIGYAVNEIEVEAENEDDAHDKALDEAGSHEYKEHDADYDVEHVTPIN